MPHLLVYSLGGVGLNSIVRRSVIPSPIPDLEEAIRAKQASWSQYLYTRFGSRDETKSAEVRKQFDDYEPKILEVFAAPRGGLQDFYPCLEIKAAVGLTGNGEFCLTYPFGSSDNQEAEQLLAQSHRLAGRVDQILEGTAKRVCLEMLFDLATNLLDLLDAEAIDGVIPQKRQHTLYFLRDDLRDIETYMLQAATRRGQHRYLLGVLVGLFVAAFMAIALAHLFVPAIDLPGVVPEPFVGSFIGGALGAAISVLNRTRFQSLVVDVDAGAGTLLLNGMFRPLVGGVLGLVLFFLLSGELLPIQGPPEPTGSFFFFSAVGFLAGFSERLAQDLLVVTAGRMLSGNPPQPPPSVTKTGGEVEPHVADAPSSDQPRGRDAADRALNALGQEE